MKTQTLKFKKILMMMLCIIVSLLSAVSCTKDELSFDQNNQTDNLTDVQANIGKSQNVFEKFENIESYKNFQFETDLVYQKQKKFLDKLKTYQVFPNQSKSLEELAKEYSLFKLDYYLYLFRLRELGEHEIMFETLESKKNYTYYYLNSLINNYQREPDREVYVEVFGYFDAKESKYYYYSPGEAYKLTYEERVKYRNRYGDRENEKYYFTKYFTVDAYSKISGIPKEEITNLRIITFNNTQRYKRKTELLQNHFEATLYLYQFPFVDNYKDYQNDSKFLYSFDKHRLKKYIKPGSCIFVFDKPLDQLDNLFGKNFGHMMIVSDYYYSLPKNMNSKDIKSDFSEYGYQDLLKYKRLSKNQDFVEIDELRKDIYDDNVSFEDYLKRFVLIEAVKDDTKYENNKQYFDKRKGVIFSSGNDKVIQDNFKNKYTVTSVSNLNKGIKMYYENLQRNFLDYCKYSVINNRSYDQLPDLKDNKYESYCSGLVYFGYKDSGITILNHDQYSLFDNIGWYMPRSITNSPFMYTRIWYKYDYKTTYDH